MRVIVTFNFLSQWQRNDEDYLKNHEDSMSDAMNLLSCLANGLSVDIKFTRLLLCFSVSIITERVYSLCRIDDFELTRERSIFDVFKIPLYHGWIVDPEVNIDSF